MGVDRQIRLVDEIERLARRDVEGGVRRDIGRGESAQGIGLDQQITAEVDIAVGMMSPLAMAEPASVRLPFSWAVIATEFRKVADPPASTERWALAFTLGDSAPLPAAWLEATAPTARSPITTRLPDGEVSQALARAPWMPLLLAVACTLTLPPRTMPPVPASSVRLAWALD